MTTPFYWQDIATGWGLLSSGLMTTLGMALGAGIFSLAGGAVLAVCRHEGPQWLRAMVAVYVEFIRSIPLILFLAFVHFGLMSAINHELGLPDNPLLSAIVGMSLFEAAYFAEILRGGLISLKPTERDAARSLGLTFYQRLFFVFLPLAFSRMMPALVGQLISLIKDTSLASIISVLELTRQGQIVYENTYHPVEILSFVAVVYFVICFALGRLAQFLEPVNRANQRPVSRVPLFSIGA